VWVCREDFRPFFTPFGEGSVLPDGIFSDQKSQFGKILEGLAMEDVGIFATILSILQTNGIFYGHLVQFWVIWYITSRFDMLYRENYGNPGEDIGSFFRNNDVKKYSFLFRNKILTPDWRLRNHD
jgi:hypothetical protein